LVDAGLAQERMHEERQLMRDMLFPHTDGERLKLMNSLQINTTDGQWQAYADSIFEPEDRQNYEAMMLVRSNYLQTFPKFVGLVKAGKIGEASAFFDGDQSRLFQKYVAAAKIIFEYNTQQGGERGQTILNGIRYAPWVIGILCILIFLCGIALGLRSALGGTK
jgi:hypothetical protein